MSEQTLSFYFNDCPKFKELLDGIREKQPQSRYEAISLSVAVTVGLPLNESDVILHYLQMGKFEPTTARETTAIIDWNKKEYYPSNNPKVYFIATISTLLDEDEPSLARGVSIHLDPETTKEELEKFIGDYWDDIKAALDSNFPERVKNDGKIPRLNDWLDIAEKMYSYKKENDLRKTDFIHNLAAEYKTSSTEIYEQAKRYRDLVGLKLTPFEPDVKSD